MLDPGVVGVTLRGHTVLPARIGLEAVTTPRTHVEGWIGQDRVCLEFGVQVVQETVCVLWAQVRFDATDGQVHAGEAPCRVVEFLTIDGDAPLVAVRFNELLALHKHATRATTRVIDAPLVRRQHLNERPDDTARRIELAALLALGAGKLRKEVLVHAAEDIRGAALRVVETDTTHEVDEATETFLVHA